MFELKSCIITGREKRGDASNMFNIHIASYDVTQSLTAPSEYNLLVEKESK